jgi:hypothetical protein
MTLDELFETQVHLTITKKLFDEIQYNLKGGRKIHAIKALRVGGGEIYLGLKMAKEIVENIENGVFRASPWGSASYYDVPAKHVSVSTVTIVSYVVA